MQLDCTKRRIRSIENPCGSCFVGARAQGDAVGQIFDAPCQFEFEQHYPHRAPSLRRAGQFVECDGQGPSRVMIRSRPASGFVAGPLEGASPPLRNSRPSCNATP
jgi:hypothetical protein